jgi:hypothetical protein
MNVKNYHQGGKVKYLLTQGFLPNPFGSGQGISLTTVTKHGFNKP